MFLLYFFSLANLMLLSFISHYIALWCLKVNVYI